MSRSAPALVWLWDELKPHDPDFRLNGILTVKSGYHNTRRNHALGVNGGSRGDYSIELPIDRVGPDDCGCAIDINLESARLRGDFDNIAKYCQRLDRAFRNEDPRLFTTYDGKRQAVWREFFGNTDADRQVEGWSLYRKRFASSDPSHLWHIHLSLHRAFAENRGAVAGMRDILLGKPIEPPAPDPGEDMTPEQARQLAEVHAKVALLPKALWDYKAPTAAATMGGYQTGSAGKLDAEKERDKTTDARLSAIERDVSMILAKLTEISPTPTE